ncbi:hypothetical protein D3C76_1732440 [compost metagenome]
MKNNNAATAAAIMVFLCASRLPLMMSPQPIATKTALITINDVLIVGNNVYKSNLHPPKYFMSVGFILRPYVRLLNPN